MKTSIYPVMFILSLLTFASCKKDDNPVDSSSVNQQILPLKAGNTWIFHVIGYDSTGTITGAGGNGSMVVGKDTVIGTETWHQFQNNTTFLINKSDGVWLMEAGISAIAPALYFKYPANAGDIVSLATFQVSVYEKNISVTVPLGTYTCYRYRITYNSQLIEDVYLAPGVGFIAIDSYSTTNSGQVYCDTKLSLVSVTIK